MTRRSLTARTGALLGALLLLAGSLSAQTAAVRAEEIPQADTSARYDPRSWRAGYEAGYAAGYADGRLLRHSSAQCSERPAERPQRFVHRIGAEFRPEYVFPTNPFLRGDNRMGRQMASSLSIHLRYSFRFRSESRPARIYGDVYQGIGAAHYRLGNSQELGDPTLVYVFQGARIARLAPRLSLDYEWNFGLSWGWHPYDRDRNPRNIMTGSKLNAYLNVDLLLHWAPARRLDVTAGLTLTHFSNGNTQLPNAGLNAIGLKVGVDCNLGQAALRPAPADRTAAEAIPFRRHVSYDLTFFGSWRRKGVAFNGEMLASPDAYAVAGFNFAPMYDFSHKFRAGLSLDGVYDGSANVYTEDYIISDGGYNPGYTFYKPAFVRQISLGLSARAEFVMPYFSLNIGLGVNVLHKGGDLKSFYQVLALKANLSRRAYLHVGYCLKDFHMPNYLMLGMGVRFNAKRPPLR